MLQKRSYSNLYSGLHKSLKMHKQMRYIYLFLSQGSGLHIGSDYRSLNSRSNVRVTSPAGSVLMSGDWLSVKR